MFAMVAVSNAAFAISDSMNGSNDKSKVGIKVGGMPYSIAVNPSLDVVYVADKFSKKVSFIDGSTGELIRKVNLTGDNTTAYSDSDR